MIRPNVQSIIDFEILIRVVARQQLELNPGRALQASAF
jgi:hypothetical protein